MAKKAADDAKTLNVTPATVLAAVAELTDYQDKVKTAQSLYSNRRKYWKNEGVNLTQLDAILALKKRDSADVLADELDRARYATWLGVELGTQASFDLDEPEPEHRDQLAKYDAQRDGRNFGLRGEGPELNPHLPGTIAHVAWETGRADNYVVGKVVPIGKAGDRKPKKGVGAESA